jgi:acyl-phosphate glycerol 3-phosphate acyltransferase
MAWLPFLLAPLAGYLIGSIPFGYLVARARGVDIFHQGSGNIGATNVGRVLGRRFGVLVFVLDVAKGALPVLGTQLFDTAEARGWLGVLAGLAAFLGHLFPLYLGMRGGKGVATGTGVALMLVPGPTLAALGVWILAVLATRYVSVASILAAITLATTQVAASNNWSDPRTLFCLLAAVLVIVKHRSNISRLAEGRENQLRENPAMTSLTKSLHVIAVALWFGGAVFFSFVVAPVLFSSFEDLGKRQPRPGWFPPTPLFSRSDDAINGPQEQGVRAAGYAITPMFPWYFVVQGVCGLIAVATALPWAKLGGVHRWRLSALLIALLLVVIGWPMERYIEAGLPGGSGKGLRDSRDRTTEEYLRAPEPAQALSAMRAARGEFGMWHGFSLMVNYAVIAFVLIGTALAAHLPAAPIPAPPTRSDAAGSAPEPPAIADMSAAIQVKGGGPD